MNTFGSLDSGNLGRNPRLDVLPQQEFQTLNKQWDQNNARMQSTMGQIGMLGQMPNQEAADPLRVQALSRLFNSLAPEQRQIAEQTAINRLSAIRPQLETLLGTARSNLGQLPENVRMALERDIIEPMREQPSADPAQDNNLATFVVRRPNGLAFNTRKGEQARVQLNAIAAGPLQTRQTRTGIQALQQALDLYERTMFNIAPGVPTPSGLAAEQSAPRYNENGQRIPTTGEQSLHVVRLMGTLVGSAGLIWSGFTWLFSGQGAGIAGFYAASLAAIAYGPRLLEGEVEHYVRDVQDFGRSPLFQSLLRNYNMSQNGDAWANVAQRLMNPNPPDALRIIAEARDRIGTPTQEQQQELKKAQESLLKSLEPAAAIRDAVQTMITQNAGRDMMTFAGAMRQHGDNDQERNLILGYIRSGANEGMLTQLGDFARTIPRA